jgi:hypothetical protein
MLQRRNRRPSALLIVALAATVALAFLASVSANTAETKVLQGQYYKDVLAETDAYDRAYMGLAGDGESGPLNDLGIAGDVLGGLGDAIAPTIIEEAVGIAIDDLIAFLKDRQPLDLSLDITDFSPIDGETIGAIGGLIGGIAGDGEGDGDDIGSAISDFFGDDEDDATPAPASNARSAPASAAGGTCGADVSNFDINQFIHERQTASGETRLVVGASQQVNREVEKTLQPFHTVTTISAVTRVVAPIVFLGAVVALFLFVPTATALKWGGASLVAAGLAGVVGWLAARSVLATEIKDAAFSAGECIPPDLASLTRDVIDTAVNNLSMSIWVPSAIAILVGGLAIAGSVMSKRTASRAAA